MKINLSELRKKYVNKETMTYLVAGVLTTLVNYIVFFIFDKMGKQVIISQLAAFIAAVIFAYVVNKKYVFLSKDWSFKTVCSEFATFTSARIFSFVIETIFILMSVGFFSLHLYIAKFIASVFVVIFNYVVSKNVIFTDKEKKKWSFKDNVVYILAFAIPLVIMIIIYYGREIYPFGENCYLRSDMYHQYAPFYSELWNKLKNGGDLRYSFNIGLGTNFIALYSYYLASPVNWLISLFAQRSLIEVMNVIILLKIAFTSLSFTYYLTKHYNRKDITISLFGMFYSLSAYITAYAWNIMWLDCLILFPLIILGLEKLLTEDKYMLYTISLALCIYTNYYISIMVCIALVFIFIAKIISLPKPEKWTDYIIKAARFGVCSLLAGGVGAMLLLPAYSALKLSASSEITKVEVLSEYFPLFEMLVRQLPLVEVHMGLEHFPNIYCGVAVFFLFPLYIMNPKVDNRSKITNCLLLMVLLTSFNMNKLNYLWHGLRFPNSLPARQSFIYCFLLLTMCCEGFLNFKEYTKKQISAAIWIVIAFLILAEEIYAGDTYKFTIMYIAGAFIVVYGVLAYMSQNPKFPKGLVLFLIFSVAIVECTMNVEVTGFSTTGRTYYLSDYDNIEALKNVVAEDDKGFYRIEKFSGFRSKNDTSWHNIKGLATFSSTANVGMTNLMRTLGCEASYNAYSANGATVLTSAMFNIKYTLSNYYREEGDDLSFYYAVGDNYLYKNNYTLPVGFMVDVDDIDYWDFSLATPFEIQNNFIEKTTGIPDTFYKLATTIDGTNINITTTQKQHIYIHVTNSSVSTVKVSVNGNLRTYDRMRDNYIIDLGYISPTDVVYIDGFASGGYLTSFEAYTYDEESFEKAFNKLNEGALNVSYHDDTTIKGSVNAKENQLMFCSIPYDTGWTVLVDDQKVDTFKIKDALLGFNVPSGQHTIELSYEPGGFALGKTITVVSIALIMIMYVVDKKYKARKVSE